MAVGTPVNTTDDSAVRLEQVSAKIRKQITDVMGDPHDLRRVQVRLLWDNHYRANVLVGDSPTCVEIRHSFFVTIDGEGTILASIPAMERLY